MFVRFCYLEMVINICYYSIGVGKVYKGCFHINYNGRKNIK